ncbi:DNAJB12 [Cordylochernes scorpioides]|uniref:DNAJB12 n=1 Tax=Cordylochernes scorpioides TaxID=51811 RepID=A0ABY6KEN4_9ARAC|nr:DNAJB12 [Cordylochernes scorpioides]
MAVVQISWISYRRDSLPKKDGSAPEAASTSAEYTKEQLTAVQHIKKCKDYYEILGVSKDCDDTELKKQYKRLALQFHPDKNKAPGAAEAFKAIGNAFSVLSDPDKKKKYDMYGSEESQRNHVHHHSENYDYSRGFEGDISAEELFNIFFGGGFNTGWSYQGYSLPSLITQLVHSIVLL